MLLEAMAAGLPSIATNIGGTPDIIKDCENVCFMRTGDDSGLSERLRSVLGNEAMLDATAAKAVESASEFNVHRIAAETIALYRKVIEDYRS